MRVINLLISTLNACALYNKGVSRVVVPVACNAIKAREVLKKENKEKMLNYLVVSNKRILSPNFNSFFLSRLRPCPCNSMCLPTFLNSANVVY